MKPCVASALVLWLGAQPLAAQEFPRPTDEGARQLKWFLTECIAAGGLRRVRDPETEERRLVVADAVALREAVTVHRRLLTPSLCDALVAYCAGADERDAPAALAWLRAVADETKDTRLGAFAAFIMAGSQMRALNYAAARPAMLEARRLFAAVKDAAWQAACANQLGTLAMHQGDYAVALDQFQQALLIHRKLHGEQSLAVARALSNVGSVHAQQGDYGMALESFQKTLAIRRQALGEDDPAVAASLNNIADVYFQQGDLARSLELTQQALAMRRKAPGDQRFHIATLLNNIGAVHGQRGEHVQALAHYRQALDLFRKVVDEQHPRVISTLINVGAIYAAQDDYLQALEHYHRADILLKKSKGIPDPNTMTSLLHHLGNFHLHFGSPWQARKFYLMALDIRYKVHGQHHPNIAHSKNSIGSTYLDEHEYALARQQFERALAILRRAYGERHPNVAASWSNIAATYYRQNRNADALENFTAALGALCDKPVPIDRLVARDLKPLPLTVRVLSNRGLALEKAGTGAAADDLRELARNYTLAIDVLERVRQDVLKTEASKVVEGARVFDLFPSYVGVCRQLFSLEGKTADLEAAFTAAEHGLARAFLEALGGSRARTLGGVSPDLRSREEELLAQQRRLEERIGAEDHKTMGETRTKRLAQLWDERLQIEDELKKLIQEMEHDFPQYAALKYPKPCALGEVRACLAPDEVALLFVPGTNVSFVVLVQSRPRPGDKANGLVIVQLPGTAVLAEHVAALNDLETLALPARVKALGRDAFDAILGPCRERIEGKSLVIVPLDSLCQLPFELLVEEDGKYLVEKHRIRYTPSLTALHLIHLWKQKRAAPDVPLFAVGDPLYDTGENVAAAKFKRLVHSGTEIAEIAKLLGAKSDYILAGADASEAKVKAASTAEKMAKARYVHFASHGILGVDKGKQPALVLNLVGNSGEDGFLEMDEITNLKLNADLVVLSACRTGQGRMARGEGVTGLARAFLYAGSKGVVCSLWSVDDRETSNLMVDFYSHLQNGHSAAEALREAKLAMIRAGKSPLYWAPFILIGE